MVKMWVRGLVAGLSLVGVWGAGVGQERGLGTKATGQEYVGFDRNDYPGDAALPGLRRKFAFTGYWLTNPPGETGNSWKGKRAILLRQGFGFVVLANGREEAAIKAVCAATHGSAQGLGQRDAADAVAAAKREGFPAGTILFLDQEEGGRLEQIQADYLLGWTERVASLGYRAGVYGSGQPVSDGPGHMITTVEDIRAQVAKRHLHAVTLFVYQDGCPPSVGCRMQPPRLGASGTVGAAVWQYAQSPRRRENTAACAATYAADGNCYVTDAPGVHLDLNVAGSADPSQGGTQGRAHER